MEQVLMMLMQTATEYAAKSAEGAHVLTEEERLAYDQMLKATRAYNRWLELNYKKLVDEELKKDPKIDEKELF